jgi:hypothetical protein
MAAGNAIDPQDSSVNDRKLSLARAQSIPRLIKFLSSTTCRGFQEDRDHHHPFGQQGAYR